MEFQLVEFELKSSKRRNSDSTVLVTVTPRRHTGDCGRRRASTRRPSRVSAALHLADASNLPASSRSSPPSPSSSSSGARSSRVTVARRTSHCSPPRLVSSRPELRNLAPKLVHPSTSAAVPYPGRIGLAPSSDRRSPSPFPPSSAPLRRAPSPRSPPPKIDPR